jgi:autotransporter-associated beta strand protein
MKSGAGTLEIATAPSLTAPMEIQQGTVRTTTQALTFEATGAGTLELAQNFDGTVNQTLSVGTFVKSGTGTVELVATPALTGSMHIRQGTVRATSDAVTVDVTGSGTLELSQDFDGGVSTSLSVSRLLTTGPGTVVLAGTTDNPGLVATVSEGTLALAKQSSQTVHALGGGAHRILPNGTLGLYGPGGDQIHDSASLEVEGRMIFGSVSETVSSISGSGFILNYFGTASLAVGAGDASSTFHGMIGADLGSFTLEKIGSGFLFLRGEIDNPNLNASVNAGTLVLGKEGSRPGLHALGPGTHRIAPGAAMRLEGSGGEQIADGARVINNGLFDLQGRNETIAALEGTGLVSNSFQNSVLTVGAGNASSRFDGTLASGAGTLALAKTGNGTFTLAGAQDNIGLRADVLQGTLELASPSSASVHPLGGGTHTVATGATLRLAGTGGDQIFDTARVVLDGTFDLGGRTETIARLSGSGGLVTGGGALTLTSPDDVGTLAVQSATLVVNGSLGGSLLIGPGAVLGGSGAVGALRLEGALAPGNSPGSLTAQSAVLAAGSEFRWEITNTAPGGQPSALVWDRLLLSGSLAIEAAPASPARIVLSFLQTPGAAGAASILDEFSPASFSLVQAPGGVTGFDANAFTVDTSGLGVAFSGSWRVVQDIQGLNLAYTPIPEPGAFALLAGLASTLAALVRRRSRAS